MFTKLFAFIKGASFTTKIIMMTDGDVAAWVIFGEIGLGRKQWKKDLLLTRLSVPLGGFLADAGEYFI